MSKNEFKEFVRKNPKLIKYVRNEQMTWQKFYEMYELYGEQESVWNEYLEDEKKEIVKDAANSSLVSFGVNDFVKWMKNVNLDSVQEGIGNIQRVLGVFQDFTKKDSSSSNVKTEYKPRPLYKHFED